MMDVGRMVRHKTDPTQWGYVDGEGTITTALGNEHRIVRVMWANDAVRRVPCDLQYADDVEDFPAEDPGT